MATLQTRYDVLPNGAFVFYSDTIPNSLGAGVTGRAGDLCINVSTASGQPIVWRCTAGGSPGTWEIAGQGATVVAAGGANNAITASIAGASLTVGLLIHVKLGTLTLQAGANTLAFNGGAAASIKSHFNIANNIATAYAASSIVPLMWDGTEWQDMSQ